MLSDIYIKNFVIVDKKTISFSEGLNVLSGETGAGKSILIDALGLQLGDRSDSGWIRKGHKRCDIHSEFQLSLKSPAKKWLDENEFNEENNCQLRRTISENGKSKCYINGIPTTVSNTKLVGEMLVDIHGQHAHQSLMVKEEQMVLLDKYAENTSLLAIVKEKHGNWQSLLKQQKILNKDGDDLADELNYLNYQVEELANINLKENEFEQLTKTQKRLSSKRDIIDQTEQLKNILCQENHLTEQLFQLSKISDDIVQLDDSFSNVQEFVNQLMIYIDEARGSLNDYVASLDMDSDLLNEVEFRMSQLYDLSRKHRVEPSELSTIQNTLTCRIDNIQILIDKLKTIDLDIEKAEIAYRKYANQLKESREKAKKLLINSVNQQLSVLNMKNAKFGVYLKKVSPRANGMEGVTFMFSANPDQGEKPLHKIASGGELSRVSLAIQVASVAKKSDVTLIFDEVDSGVGGATAEVVGRLLKTLSKYNQIICVTHLPQVAAFADNHIKISKAVTEDKTVTDFTRLNQKERVEELARMSGGISMDKKTREHAQNLLNNAVQFSSTRN